MEKGLHTAVLYIKPKVDECGQCTCWGGRIVQSVKRCVFVWRLATCTYLFRSGSNRAGGMLAKKLKKKKKKKDIKKKKKSMKIPADCMSGLTVPAGLRWSRTVFPRLPGLPWLSSTSRQSCKMRL